jgi:hypothetical protein
MWQATPKEEVPVMHILMAVSGWYVCAAAPNVYTFLCAATLSILAVPRFVRGPWEAADARITLELQMPIQPSKRVAHIIPSDEDLLWETREHPISMILWWTSAIALQGLVVIINEITNWEIAGVVWLVGMLFIAGKTLLWRHDRLCLTNKRIIAVRGFLNVQHQSMPLKKLTDETLVIPWHSTVLSWLRLVEVPYGTLIVESAGQDQALSKVLYVPRVTQINRKIMSGALS